MYRRLLAINTLLIFTMLACMLAGVIGTVKNIVLEENSRVSEAVIQVGFSRISAQFREIQSAVLSGCVDEDVQKILSDEHPQGFVLGGQEAARLKKAMLGITRGRNGAYAQIFPMVDGVPFQMDYATQTFRPQPDLLEEPFMTRDMLERGAFSWTVSQRNGERVVRAAHAVYDQKQIDRVIGVMAVDLNLDSLYSVLRTISSEQNDAVCLLDSSGRVVLPFTAHFTLPEELLQSKTPRSFIDQNMQHYFVQIIPENHWKLAGVLGESSLMQKWKRTERTIFGVGILLTALSAFLSLLIARSVTRPIMELARRMQDFEASDFKLDLIDSSRQQDEVAVLYNSFNHMQKRLNELIEEVYKARVEEQKALMQALQAQINPHFLYNTLDSINWMAMKYDAEDIQQMVSSLAAMLRHSLNKGNDFITVKNELEQVRSFLQIQMIRFSGSFDVTWQIDPEVMDLVVIKLILQPLVENAIQHGFVRGTKGRLILEGYRSGDLLILQVKNDGRPIDLKRASDILHGRAQSVKPSGGYGLYNVNARLTRHYGERYGIVFHYEDGWTIATIQIPLEGESCLRGDETGRKTPPAAARTREEKQ